MRRLRAGWFSTGRGPGSRALLREVMTAIEHGLPIDLGCVFCNREPGEDAQSDEFLSLARGYRLPVVTLSSSRFRRTFGGQIVRKGDPLPAWRLAFDDEVLQLVEPYGISLAVLAGYMLIFGDAACRRLPLLNLHPAAPGGPAGIWQDVIWQLIGEHAEQSGVTMFRAVPKVDAGPPISYCRYALRDAGTEPLWQAIAGRTVAELQTTPGESLPLFNEIRRRGAAREPVLIIETLRAVGERGILELGAAVEPFDLTDFVDHVLVERQPARSPDA